MTDLFAGEKNVHIYSTLTNAQQYPVYRKSPQGENILEGHVHINGDAGLANKNLITSLGAYTPITPEALQHLQRSHVFQQHVKNGFITVREKPVDIEKAVSEHTSVRDNSAPLTPEDYAGADPDTDAIPSTKGSQNGRGRKVVTQR
jgi:hypothetical protein